MPDTQQAINGLKEAYNRLSAWSDNADLWASRMNDLDAIPYRNQAVNYRYCQERIEAAIQAFRSTY